MRLYRRSGLAKDLLQMFQAIEGTKAGAEALQTFTDTWEDNVGEYMDKAVEAVLSAYGDDADRWRKLAKKATKEAITKAVDVLVEGMKTQLGGVISIDDILAALSSEEDIAAIKCVALEADMYKLRRGVEYNSKGEPIYQTTVDAMSDALYNYDNAPRSENATHIAVFTAIPSGIFPYLATEMASILRLMSDPVFKGFGLEDLGSEEMWSTLGKYFADQAKELAFKEKEVLTSTPVLKKSNKLGIKTTSKKNDRYEAINRYNWRVEVKASANPVLPVSNDKRVAVRFRLIRDIEISSDTQALLLKRSYTPYTMGPDLNTAPSDTQIFLTQVTKSSTVKYAVLRMPLEEIFVTPSFGTVLEVIERTGAILLAEFWEYELDSTGNIVLTALMDARPVNMNTGINADKLCWYGASVDGLGSVVPGLDQAVEMAKAYMNELIEKMLKTDEFAQSVMSDLYELIVNTLMRIATVLKKIIMLIVKVFRVLMSCDVRYAVFYGSYTDIPLIWMMIRGDYKLVEAMGNSITATIISCKGDYYKKVKDKVDELMSSTAARKLYFAEEDRRKAEAALIDELTASSTVPAEGTVIKASPGIPSYGSRENDADRDLNIGQEPGGSIMSSGSSSQGKYLITIPVYKGD